MFICGCLEEGRDGVGDYTRKLADAIKANFENIFLIAYNDSLVKDLSTTEIGNIKILRIPSNTSNKHKFRTLKCFVIENKISLISIQFVPFAFHTKGLPINLVSSLGKFNGINWHIMFHELWTGMEKRDSFKLKLLGFFQLQIIKRLVKKLKPKFIHTSNDLYKHYLRDKINITIVKELPIFGNIKRQTGYTKKPDNVCHIVLFAGIHSDAPVSNFLQWLMEQSKVMMINVHFTFVGRNGPFANEWISLLNDKGIFCQILGNQEEALISKLFSSCDFGISTTPYYLSSKSGSVAAMLEHELPVLCVARSWIPNVNVELTSLKPNDVIEWNPSLKLQEILKTRLMKQSIAMVAEKFIEDLI